MNLLFCLLCIFSIPDESFSFKGKTPREIITLDPQNSPFLQQAYESLSNQLNPHYTEWEILQITNLYVQQTLFDLSLCTEKNTNQLLTALYPDQKEPLVCIEHFLKEKTGVCRHIALVTTYLVDQLSKNGWLKGEAFLIREQLPDTRHAWTLFLSETSAWHLDPLWNILEDAKTETGFYRLCHKYSKQTMNLQKCYWE